MNPGKLRERGVLLRLSGEKDLKWEENSGIWMQVKETGRKNLFSKVGIGSDGVEIVLRKRDMTLHDAISWKGQHYFLTNITEEGIAPVYLKIQAARITPVIVTVWKNQISMGNLNQAESLWEQAGSFPACVTEKYLASRDEESHIESEIRLIAVTPKAAVYQAGDIFEISEKKFRVMVVHNLESWKNEYEIQRIEDN